MRGFDPRARVAFAALLLALVALIVRTHGAGGLLMAAELAIPAVLVAGWVGGTGLVDWWRGRGKG